MSDRPTRDWPEEKRAAWYDAHREEVESWPEVPPPEKRTTEWILSHADELADRFEQLPPFVDDGRWGPCTCRHPQSFHKDGGCVGKSCDCSEFVLDVEADDRRHALDRLSYESWRLGLQR